MSNMNSCVLSGNIVRSPELRYTQTGSAKVSFTIAVNEKYKKEETVVEETSFVPVVAWGKLGETCANFLVGGQKVTIGGKLKIRKYTSQEGESKNWTEIVANQVEFGPKPKSHYDENQGEGQQSSDSGDQQSSTPIDVNEENVFD